MEFPFFTVVIPVYNRRDELRAVLISLKDQTTTDFEVIVVDDGSTDDLSDVVEKITDYPITLIRQENLGGGAARNKGITNARGKYIAFLDSDDFFLPEKLAKCRSVIEQTNATMIYSYARVARGQGVFGRKPNRGIRAGETFEHYALVAREPAQTSTLVVERNLARSVLFDPTLKKFQDIDFGIRLARAGAVIHFIPEELAIWTDNVADNRVGNKRKPTEAYEWLARHRATLTKRGFHGYRANLLSYEIGETERVRAAAYIVLGMLFGGVGIKRGVHSLCRALIPQSAYRPLVNWLLSKRSRPSDSPGSPR